MINKLIAAHSDQLFSKYPIHETVKGMITEICLKGQCFCMDFDIWNDIHDRLFSPPTKEERQAVFLEHKKSFKLPYPYLIIELMNMPDKLYKKLLEINPEAGRKQCLLLQEYNNRLFMYTLSGGKDWINVLDGMLYISDLEEYNQETGAKTNLIKVLNVSDPEKLEVDETVTQERMLSLNMIKTLFYSINTNKMILKTTSLRKKKHSFVSETIDNCSDKILKIKLNPDYKEEVVSDVINTDVDLLCTERNSPRAHQRRGHFRNYKGRKIWIRNSVINADREFTVKKEYKAVN